MVRGIAHTSDVGCVLEDDHRTVRQELAEIQERQDFTERALLRDGGQAKPPAPVVLPDRVVTPR